MGRPGPIRVSARVCRLRGDSSTSGSVGWLPTHWVGREEGGLQASAGGGEPAWPPLTAGERYFDCVRVGRWSRCSQRLLLPPNVPLLPTGGRLQPVLMRHTPQLSVKTWGGGGAVGGGGPAGGRGGGVKVGVGGVLRKLSGAKGANFFFHTMCLYSKYSKFCREFIFVLKQQEKEFDKKKGYRRAAGPNSNPSPNPPGRTSRDTCWWPPRHHYLSKPGGGGGLGGVAYKDRARPPPRAPAGAGEVHATSVPRQRSLEG